MRPETRQRLLEISVRFYVRHGSSFDATRAQPWPGWTRLWESLRDGLPASGELCCFDAGCGNGRFALFLAEQLGTAGAGKRLAYVGVDLDSGLLDAARRDLAALPHAVLQQADLCGSDDPHVEPGSQDLVTLFGVLHHVPEEATRRAMLQKLAGLLAPGGRLVVSIWRLDQDPVRFEKKLVPWTLWNETQPTAQRVSLRDLEDGDVLLSWRGDQEAPRYCHFPTEGEIERLVALDSRLEPVERFVADGPTGRDNLYLTWRRLAAC